MQAKSIKGNSPEEIKHSQDKSFNANDLDTTLHKINVVPQDISRVFLNLINNAFYAYTERSQSAVGNVGTRDDLNLQPTVTVSTKNLGDKIQISVKDNGPGIPDHVKDKIFQPFFTTIPIAIGTTGQGTGLGLSLSYDIVKAHGGEFKLKTKENDGSEFTIILPIVKL